MPEISEQPVTSPVLTHSNLGAYLERFTASTDEGSPERSDISWRMKLAVNKFRGEHPNLSPEKVDLLSHLVFGPWMLSAEAVTSGTNEFKQKELSARIQHHLAHSIYYAGRPEADPGYVENTYKLLATYGKLAKLPFSQESGIASFMSGVSSELSIMRALSSRGCAIYPPDYIKEADMPKGIHSETGDLDVLFGTDLIAVTADGRMFFIDAKGQKFLRDANGNRTQTLNTSVRVKGNGTLSLDNPGPRDLPKIREAVSRIREERNLPDKRIIKTTIIVPTDSSQMGTLEKPVETNNKALGVRQFGTLLPEHQNDIIRGLTEVLRNANQN